MTEVLTLIVLLAIAVKQFWPQLSHSVTWLRLWAIGNLSGIGGALDKRGPLWLAVGVLVGVVLTVGMQRLPVRIELPEWWKNPTVFVPSTKPDTAVYIYEKDSGGIPSGVAVGIDKLNRQGLLATNFEDDTTDGDGDVPDQYKVPLAAAREAGLPALVVMGGGEVLRVVKVTGEADTLEAVR